MTHSHNVAAICYFISFASCFAFNSHFDFFYFSIKWYWCFDVLIAVPWSLNTECTVLYSSMSLTDGLSVSNGAAMVEFDFKLNERQENGSICTVFSVRAWNLLNDCYYRCCDCNYDCFHLFRRVLFFFSSIFHFTNQLQLVMIKITAITLQLRFHFIFAVNHFISQNIPFIDHQR